MFAYYLWANALLDHINPLWRRQESEGIAYEGRRAATAETQTSALAFQVISYSESTHPAGPVMRLGLLVLVLNVRVEVGR